MERLVVQLIYEIIGASLSEPHNCWCLLPLRACVRVYVCTYVRGGVRCLGASAASDVWERVQYRLRTIERPGQECLAQHGSVETIITKKRFVPVSFYHVHGAMKVAWTAASGTGVGYELSKG